MLNVNDSSNIYEDIYQLIVKNNVKLDDKSKFKFMKTL